MTHTSTEQPEALQYATALRSNSVFFTPKYMGFIADELERLHARVQELEASQAQRVPLSEPITHVAYRPTWDGETWALTQIAPMNSIKVDQLKTHWVTHRDFSDDPFTAGLRYAERAHGITQEKQG